MTQLSCLKVIDCRKLIRKPKPLRIIKHFLMTGSMIPPDCSHTKFAIERPRSLPAHIRRENPFVHRGGRRTQLWQHSPGWFTICYNTKWDYPQLLASRVFPNHPWARLIWHPLYRLIRHESLFSTVRQISAVTIYYEFSTTASLPTTAIDFNGRLTIPSKELLFSKWFYCLWLYQHAYLPLHATTAISPIT